MRDCFITFFLFLLLSITAHARVMTLSLHEAILLGVRNHPNIQSAQLNHLAQKFNLALQLWQFQPHYSLQTAINSNQHVNLQAGSSLITPIGTQINVASLNGDPGSFSPGLSIQIVQPLIRGFGKAIIETTLNNAKDSEIISRLNIEGVLRQIITNIINAYLNIVSAKQAIFIDEKALQRAEAAVNQTKIFIRAGHKAGNELVTVEANVATAKANLENDKNNLKQAQYGLLTAIGLDPTTEIHFSDLNIAALIEKYQFPTQKETITQALKNDIQFQIDSITLEGATRRSLLLAEDNTRWQLNFTANATVNANKNINNDDTATLSLQIPIDDQIAKQGVINAKIALKQAKLALMQEKWSRQTEAINSWNTVMSAKGTLQFAEQAAKLQDKTYQLNYQKYLHGLIDSLDLQSAQMQLVQAEQTVSNANILYLKSLVNLDLLVGHTLKTWHIQVR